MFCSLRRSTRGKIRKSRVAVKHSQKCHVHTCIKSLFKWVQLHSKVTSRHSNTLIIRNKKNFSPYSKGGPGPHRVCLFFHENTHSPNDATSGKMDAELINKQALNAQNSPLLALPGEFRNTIYRYALCEPDVDTKCDSTEIHARTSLLRTCTQIRDESSAIFYAGNKFATLQSGDDDQYDSTA